MKQCIVSPDYTINMVILETIPSEKQHITIRMYDNNNFANHFSCKLFKNNIFAAYSLKHFFNKISKRFLSNSYVTKIYVCNEKKILHVEMTLPYLKIFKKTYKFDLLR